MSVELHVVQILLLPDRPYASLRPCQCYDTSHKQVVQSNASLGRAYATYITIHCVKDVDLNTMPMNKHSLSTLSSTLLNVYSQQTLNGELFNFQWVIRSQNWWFTDMCSGLCSEHMITSLTACSSSRGHLV